MTPTQRLDAELDHRGPWNADTKFVREPFVRDIVKDLAQMTKERDKAKEDFFKAVENAGPRGACAEAIACGSTMYEHIDCPITERDALRAQLLASQVREESMRESVNYLLDTTNWPKACEHARSILALPIDTALVDALRDALKAGMACAKQCPLNTTYHERVMDAAISLLGQREDPAP